MARPLRVEVAGGIHHVTARGNAKQPIYLDHLDHRRFLATLERVLSRYEWRCLGYCLMVNHYHLLVQTLRPNLADGMRELNSVYAQHFNRRYDRCGHLFQARYSAVLVQRDQHLLETARYIALNAVRAGLCESPMDWPWSSHPAVLGLEAPGPVAVDELLSYFAAAPGQARRRYYDFVDAACGVQPAAPDSPIFGDEAFRTEHLPPAPPSQEIPRGPWLDDRPSLAELFERLDSNEAIAVAFREFGYRMVEIARAMDCHYSTVSRRLKAWEARRSMWRCKT
jgi:putative transposase